MAQPALHHPSRWAAVLVDKLRLAGACALLLLAIFVGFAKPFDASLPAAGHVALVGLILGLIVWVLKPFDLPLSMGGVVMLAALAAGGIPLPAVFSGFTSPAIWVLIPALFFGYALVKTGLGNRLAIGIIRSLAPTYLGLTLAWLAIGLVLSVLTPSIIVRVAIVTPIAVMCCDVAQLAPGSKGRALILLTALAMALVPGNGWLTGSLLGPVLSGMYEGVPELQGVISFGTWLQAAALPMVITSTLMVVGGFIVLRPEAPISVSKDIFDLEARKLGRWTRAETSTALILISAFAMFAAGQLHEVPDAATALLALFLLHVTGVLNLGDINVGINWDLVLFLGAALSLPAVFAATGVSKWLAGLVVPVLAPLASNPFLFVMPVVTFLFLWRFIDIAAQIPTEGILVPIIPAVAAQFGIDPLVWIPIFALTLNSMFFSYQNVFVLIGESIAGERRWTASQLLRYGVVYFVACMLALVLSVPYWVGLGYFRK